MELFLLELDDNYSKMIICSKNKESALKIGPENTFYHDELKTFISGTMEEWNLKDDDEKDNFLMWNPSHWAERIEDIKITNIGKAYDSCKEGIIMSCLPSPVIG